MRQSPEFQKRFFDFYEDIIHHHLPEDEITFDTAYEPRVERPIPPPSSLDPSIEELNTWESAFVTEIKKCGEVLQRHVCRPVCHKYGNENQCRFLFPHEIIEASYFDPDTNSVVLMCRDSTVNYFNPYILVFSRHNHDIKCIFSGKAAKAAMFYITDYITKMDLKTYEMLSLMSCAISSMPEQATSSPAYQAKMLLHKCLAQFTRQQQIHSQQAARYLRTEGDGMASHRTKPMMSAILVSNVKAIYGGVGLNVNEDDADNEDSEEISLRVTVDHDGNLMATNQFHDYYYRADSLQAMNFFDFSHCVKLEKKSNSPKNTIDTRGGVLARHSLLPPHKLADTHQLVEYWNEERGDGDEEFPPRVIGCSIPKPNAGIGFAIFVLAHFKPFGLTKPLLHKGQTFEKVLETYKFSDRARGFINNWDAINECEDACDAERIRKRAAMSVQSQVLTKSLLQDDIDIPLVDS